MQPSLRKYIGGNTSINVEGSTLRELISNMDSLYPGVSEILINKEDPTRLARGLAAVIDGEPTNMGLLTHLNSHSEVHFLPSIAGG